VNPSAEGAVTRAPSLRRTESHFDAAGGRRLFTRSWEQEGPRRHLVLVHGYAEHSGRYDRMARWFVRQGADVTGYDHQGHGRSSGIRCHVDDFDDFLDDLEIVVERARKRTPQIPLYVVGHSMGGLITCAWARERKPAVDGLLVSSPPFVPPPSLGSVKLFALRMLRRIAPRATVSSDLDPEGLSRDPAVVEAYLEDPLVYLRMTLSLAAEMFDAMERAAGGGVNVELPMLMMHGEADPICSPEASEAFARDVPGCRYRLYRKLRHEIFNEPEQEGVFDAMQTWMLEQEARSGPSASLPLEGPKPGIRSPLQ
jgi:alpha-beta hydrolase superfamily lysophospholipase